MRPSSGRTNPAMESRVSVFPEPLEPNRTVTPAAALKSRSSENPAESGPAAYCLRIFAWIILLESQRCLARSEGIGSQPIRQCQDSERDRGDNQHQHPRGCAVASFDGVVDCDGYGLSASWNVAGDHQRDAEIAQ